MKALIPAAGLGTRFLPATKAQPKEMLLVVDRPAIQYVVEEGLASGADEVVIVNSREKKAIEDHFTPNPELVALLRERGKDAYADAVEYVGNLPVSYVYQEEALGLGHAVRCAAAKTGDEAFYVLLGDVLVPGNEMLPAMKAVSDAHGGASVIAVMPVPDDQVSRLPRRKCTRLWWIRPTASTRAPWRAGSRRTTCCSAAGRDRRSRW